MIKRMMLLAGMALAAVAFTASAAQAEVYLHEDNVKLEEGAKVTATSTNLKTTRPNGTILTCTKVTLHMELIDPGTEHLELKQLGEATTFGCQLDRGPEPPLAVTIDDGTLGFGEGNVLTIDTWGTGLTNAFFRSTVFASAPDHEPPIEHGMLLANCTFEGEVHVQAKEVTGDQLEITPPNTLTGPCGEGVITGDFTLETPDVNETPVEIHYNDTT